MRNKILCLCMAIIMLLSFANCVYASSDTKTQDVEYMYNILKSLNIMGEPNPQQFVVPNTFVMITGNTGAETTDYGLFREVSKRNFINYVCNMLYDSGYTSDYSEEAVKAAESAGIIKPDQDDLYKSLYYEEAVAMLVRVLSYDQIAAQKGWPHGYVMLAKQLGLDKGLTVSVGDKLTLSDVIRLLYNTLNAPCAQVDYIRDDGVAYITDPEATFLYTYRHMYKIKGVVESTSTSSISNELQVGEGRIMIGSRVYLADKDFSDLLGLNVEAYVKETDSDIDIVVSAAASGNEELLIETGDVARVSDDISTISYYTSSDKEKTVRFAPSRAILYNGQPKTCTKDDFKPLDGYVKLIDNNGDLKWDVVFIMDYQTCVVDYVSVSNGLIRSRYAVSGDDVSLNVGAETGKDKMVIIVAEDGTPMTLDQIKRGDVLRVAMSKTTDKDVIFIEHRKLYVSGILGGMEQKDDGTYVLVGDTEYMISEYYKKAQQERKTKSIVLGNEYIFFIDSAGRIAYAEETDESVSYGLVWAVGSSGSLDPEWKIKIFTSEGEWVNYNFAEKVEYNGVMKTVDENTFDNLPCGANGDISLVCYSLNSTGRVNMLKTPVPYTDEAAEEFNVKSSITAKYRPNNTSFESETFITEGALIFLADKTTAASDDAYALGGLGNLSNDNDHTFNAYNVDDFGFAEIFVVENNDSLKNHTVSGSDLFVVKSVGLGLNSEGEKVGTVTGMFGAYEELTYYFNDESVFHDLMPGVTAGTTRASLKAGDVISVATNKKGFITYANVYYSIPEIYAPVCAEWDYGIHTINTILRGTVIENDASKYRMKMDCGTKTWTLRTAVDNLVIIYDLERNSVTRGSIGDIKENAQIVAKIKQSKLMCIVAYQ